jgi:hypothetical protein
LSHQNILPGITLRGGDTLVIGAKPTFDPALNRLRRRFRRQRCRTLPRRLRRRL